MTPTDTSLISLRSVFGLGSRYGFLDASFGSAGVSGLPMVSGPWCTPKCKGLPTTTRLIPPSGSFTEYRWRLYMARGLRSQRTPLRLWTSTQMLLDRRYWRILIEQGSIL